MKNNEDQEKSVTCDCKLCRRKERYEKSVNAVDEKFNTDVEGSLPIIGAILVLIVAVIACLIAWAIYMNPS